MSLLNNILRREHPPWFTEKHKRRRGKSAFLSCFCYLDYSAAVQLISLIERR